MPTIGGELITAAREAIRDAGGEYMGLRGDSVAFRDPQTGASCSLYIFACTRTNVFFALKDCREKVLTVAPWEPTEVAATK